MIVKLSGMGWLVCAVLTVEVPGSFRGRDRFRGQVFAGRRHDCLMRNDVRMRMRNPGSREYGRLGEGSVSECLGGKRDEGWQDGRGGSVSCFPDKADSNAVPKKCCRACGVRSENRNSREPYVVSGEMSRLCRMRHVGRNIVTGGASRSIFSAANSCGCAIVFTVVLILRS